MRDSTDIGAVARLMDAGSPGGRRKARMVFTDPPWNVDYGGAAHPSWKQRQILNDHMSSDDFFGFLCKAFAAMESASQPGATVYCVMSAAEWGNVMDALRDSGFHWSSTIIWAKDKFVLSRKDYFTQYEPIWYGWLDGVHMEDRGQSDLWEIPRPKKSPDHPTTKPIALAAKAIANSSRPGDAVLDLFGGSGTSLLAAEQTGRVGFLMELSPKYCDVICARFAKFAESYNDIFLLRDGERIPYSQAAESQ